MDDLPVVWATILSIIGFIALLVLVWCIPRHAVYQDAADGARWRDLRIWATVLIIIQLILYLIFI